MNARIDLRPEPKNFHVDQDILDAALARTELVPFATRPLVIVLAEDFHASAQAWNAIELNPQRAGGPVAGLVLPRGGAEAKPTIIIDAAKITKDVSPVRAAEFIHLFEHEAWHVVLTEHLEDGEVELAEVRRRSPRDYFFAHLAIEALREYRVEMAIARSDSTVEAARASSIHRTLTELNDLLKAAKSHASPPLLSVNDLLHDLFGYLGQLAAEEALGGDIVSSVHGHRCWDQLVGEYWMPLRDTLAPAPGASSRMGDLDIRILEIATLLRPWVVEKLRIRPEPQLIDGAGLGVHFTFDTVVAEPEDLDSP